MFCDFKKLFHKLQSLGYITSSFKQIVIINSLVQKPHCRVDKQQIM